MPERAINTKSATGFLLILIPAALAMSALFVAWPFILGMTLLVAGGNIWQSNEWSKTVRSIDPTFQQLIVQNRGEITPIDLSLKANISGTVSQRYLAAKAGEFGTGSRQHPDRGQVYYFVSISTLGRIFDDSEGELESPVLMPATNSVVVLPVAETPAEATAEVVLAAKSTPPIAAAIVQNLPAESTIIPPLQDAVVKSVTIQPIENLPVPAVVSGLSNLNRLFDEESVPITTPASVDAEHLPVADVPTTLPSNHPVVTIIQSELAKRLDVHSSTIYKRRGEPDFTEWTRNRDPDGLAWGYAEVSKEYYQVET